MEPALTGVGRRLGAAEAVLLVDTTLAGVAADGHDIGAAERVRAAARLGLELLSGAGRGLDVVRRPLDVAVASPSPDAAALRTALDEAAVAALGAAWRERAAAAAAAPPRRRRWRRPALLLASIAVLGGGVLVAVLVLARNPSSPGAPVTPAAPPLAIGGDTTLGVNPARGGCDTTFGFVARGSLSGSGSLVYRWEQSDGTTSGDTTLQITSQEGAFQLTQAWRVEGSRSFDGTETLHILKPVDRRVSQAFHYSCP